MPETETTKPSPPQLKPVYCSGESHKFVKMLAAELGENISDTADKIFTHARKLKEAGALELGD